MLDLDAFSAALEAAGAAGPRAGLPRRIGECCLDWLPITGASITAMVDADNQDPIWASNEVAARIDELQFRLAQGPCVEAFTTRRAVLIDDLAEPGAGFDHRWPMFTEAVTDTPARGMYVLPLRGGAVTLGVLDLYCDRPGALGRDELAAAWQAADALFWALLALSFGHPDDEHQVTRPHPTPQHHSTRGTGPEGTGAESPEPGDAAEHAVGRREWSASAPLTRRTVYQATGVLIEQLGVPAATAMARLRAYAFAHNRTIDEVAADVIGHRLRLPNGEDAPLGAGPGDVEGPENSNENDEDNG